MSNLFISTTSCDIRHRFICYMLLLRIMGVGVASCKLWSVIWQTNLQFITFYLLFILESKVVTFSAERRKFYKNQQNIHVAEFLDG